MRHRRDVRGGDIRSCSASGWCRGQESACGSQEFGLSRETVRKMLEFAVPPGYRRQQQVRRPKLGPWIGVIDAILDDDRQRPPKQRHTAKRIIDRLKEEHQFRGGYTIVKDYVHTAMLRGQEMFVPLVHPPGEAQADFGEALVLISGVEQKAHYLAMDLPHSDDCFVAAFPARQPKLFWKVMFRRSHTSARFRLGYSTTTRRSRWPGYWAAKSDSGRGPSPSYRVIICSPTSSVALPRATISRGVVRARWRGSSATRGATSWFRFHAPAAGTS